ncbi:unnamed protein product [Gordionus sp. m RMFG-2023]|uniref:uncharacterized protein LOC135923530 n=1 Tax=Gordionus sp. m RMFG-2023 TaxID=3053472 RepID=UPI0030E0ABCA
MDYDINFKVHYEVKYGMPSTFTKRFGLYCNGISSTFSKARVEDKNIEDIRNEIKGKNLTIKSTEYKDLQGDMILIDIESNKDMKYVVKLFGRRLIEFYVKGENTDPLSNFDDDTAELLAKIKYEWDTQMP